MYVVMPNHIHAIIEVESLDSDYYENTTALSAEIRTPNPAQRCNPDMPRHVPALSRYINMFKGAVRAMPDVINLYFNGKAVIMTI